MKNGFAFLVGLFAALTLSWAGLALGTHAQLGALAPFFDENEGSSFPARPAGVAARGQLVYADLGCASCHTQQVRRPGLGADQARGWGERQSVARDYIFQARPQLGAMRIGPDLANFGGRKPAPPAAADLMKFLYTGSATHPAYAFLFADRAIVGEPAADRLVLAGAHAPAPGRQIVPSERAQSLVAYLLNSNSPYEYPEARPVAPAAAKKESAPAGQKEAPKK